MFDDITTPVVDTLPPKLQGRFISETYYDVYKNITASGSGTHSPHRSSSVISNASELLCSPSNIIL